MFFLSESWALTKCDRQRIDAFEMRAYSRVLQSVDLSLTARRTNEWVLGMTGTGMGLRRQMALRKL